MTQAEIITIGTELLLGETLDTNTRYLAQQLRHLGVDLFRATSIGDNPLRIAEMIRESLSRAEFVITTGGLGPTIDDPTRNAAAIAFNVEMDFHADLWKEIYRKFQVRGAIPSDNNQKQAFLPANAVAIHNPVGTAPAFYIAEQKKLLVCLPGVPAEMKTIFQHEVIPLLRGHFELHQLIKTHVIRTSGIGESVVDAQIADLETSSNPTVGLSAHPGCVDIRITAKANSSQEADRMIDVVEQKVISLLQPHIYGFDQDTLLEKVIELAANRGVTVTLFVFCAINELILFSNHTNNNVFEVKKLDRPYTPQQDLNLERRALLFAVNIYCQDDIATLDMFFTSPQKHAEKKKLFNNALPQLQKWMENTCLDFIRRQLSEVENGE